MHRSTGFAFLAAVTLSACSSGEDIATARNVADRARSFYDSGDAAGFYALTSEPYRAATTDEDTARMLRLVRQAMGDCRPAGEPVGTSWYRGTGGYTITMIFERACANGPLTETYTVLMGNPPRLQGFNFNSPALLPPGPAEAPAQPVPPEAPPAPAASAT